MENIMLFGSKHWPGCEPAKEYLSKKNIKFAYVDITESMLNLKKFLKYRDNYKEFDEIKRLANVGIPCIVVNKGEKIIFNYKDIEKDL